uniref:E3 ubiquitin-protein ligase APD1-4 N-terminal domain-containing protein n=1 Tax=Timema poppense TaxID=170557 RepID=A0A7R9H9V6_TIMPO|nr:unnamed protein product [Timema poppensis]
MADRRLKTPEAGKMHGARRVITFCLLTAVLPTILLITPLYLRHSVFADVTFAVAESDVVEIVDGISTIFCQAQSLKMNTSFHSFQLGSLPERSGKRKHLHLKKSMVIPDDTLEYWGFFLPKGSTVVLSACSRYVGSRLLVVKGEKNLRTCGLMDQNEEEVLAHMASNHGQVRITFETQAQEIHEGHKLSFTNKHSLTLGDYPKISSTLSPLQVDSTPRAQYSGLQSSTKTLKEKQETHKDAEAVSYIDENTAYEQDDDDDYDAGEIKLKSQKKNETNENRQKRDANMGHVLDAGIGHGGNAVIVNVTTMPDEAKEESDKIARGEADNWGPHKQSLPQATYLLWVALGISFNMIILNRDCGEREGSIFWIRYYGLLGHPGSEPAFAWREDGKPFRNHHPSSPDRDSNLNIPVLSSRAQHD